MEAIEIHNLKKRYASGTYALKGINLKVASGDFFALLGANGAGKTTLIGILTSLVNKSSGTAKIFDLDLDHNLDKAKQYVGVVPQEFNFSIWEKVLDIIIAQAGYFGIPRKEALKRAEELLKDLHLWDKRSAPSRMLSGGMKRRLMIARALIHKPKLLILDEPSAGVDVELRYSMWEYLRTLNKQGTTILLTTHYLEEVEQLCRRVAIIKEGIIIKNDTVENLIQSLEEQAYVVKVTSAPEKFSVEGFDVKKVDDHTFEVTVSANKMIGEFVRKLAELGLTVKDIGPKGNRMEQLYLNILKK